MLRVFLARRHCDKDGYINHARIGDGGQCLRRRCGEFNRIWAFVGEGIRAAEPRLCYRDVVVHHCIRSQGILLRMGRHQAIIGPRGDGLGVGERD